MSDGCWYASFDDGVTWHNLGKVGEEGEHEPLFSEVRYDEEYVYLTLADGTTLTIPININGNDTYTLTPYIEIGPINSNGGFGTKDWGLAYYRTPRYLKAIGRTIHVTVSLTCEIEIAQYDKTFRFIGFIPWASIKAEEKKTFTLDDGCCYIRLRFRKDSSISDFPKPNVVVTNVGIDEFYEVRSSDDGYQRLTIPINVADPDASDDDSWDMQDNGQILKDYGLLVLPETYSNIGKPTRLIIYCHGAGVNYPESVTRFSSSALRPEYWLKEGYAVMDIEGNPFDNTNEHCKRLQSYVLTSD